MMKETKKYDPELKGNRLYKTTRKNHVLPRVSGGRLFKKEISESYIDPTKKKTIYQKVFYNNFNSQFTFFPLYDTDNNSVIRLKRLHAKWKKSYKKIANRICTMSEFSKTIKLMNAELFQMMLRENMELRIDKDTIALFRKKEDYKATTLQSPIRLIWECHNPYPRTNIQQKNFPKIKVLIGRPLFKDLKPLAKEINTTDLLNKIPLYRETDYSRRKWNRNKFNIKVDEFVASEEQSTDFNMFNDF